MRAGASSRRPLPRPRPEWEFSPAPSCPQDGYTAFIRAAGGGHLEIVRLLMDTGVDVNHAAQANPGDAAALRALLRLPEDFPAALADGAIEALRAGSRGDPEDQEPARDGRLTAEQKALLEKLGRIVDARAAALGISAEVLAPRGELKAMATGSRATDCTRGWRREVIGAELLAAL